MREYRGILDIAHVDVYRLERVQDVVDLGLEELGDGEAVLLVEWGDAVEELLPDERLRVELTTEDLVIGRAAAPRLGARRLVGGAVGALEVAVAPWSVAS